MRGLIEASIDGLVTVDPDLLVMDVNEQTCRMTGRSRDELIGTRFDGCFTDPSAAAEGVYRTLRDGTVADYELELAARAGEPIVVSFNAARFTDAAGAVQGVFAAARDVTDRRRAAAAIDKARERERVQAKQAAIFAEFAEGVATLDPEPGGVLESVTVQVADFIGDTCGVFVVGDDGKTLRNFAWHSREPEAVEFARRLLAVRPYTTETGPAGEVFRTGRTVVLREADMTSLREQLPAEYRPLVDRFGVASAVYLPLRAGGETLGVIVTYRFAGHPAYADAEIAFLEEFGARASLAYENARQGAARKRSQELLDAVFQTLPDLICIAGIDGYFRVLNPAWESAIGWTIAELCAKPYVEFVHPDDRQRTLDEHDKQALRGQRVSSFENRYRCRDGSYRWLQWNSLPLAERGILVANARDITEHKQAEEALAYSHRELERRSEELERSNRDLEQFAYVASHDLQEPLRMVSSYTTLLAEDLGDSLGETARRHLDYAHDGAMRMQQLVSDLLRYSQVSRAADESRQRVDCDQLVETVEVDLQEAIVAAGATVTHDRLPTLTGVRTELRQLFSNLVGNAVKFHGDEPVHVHVGAQRSDSMWRFSVADNGIGIDPAQAERIFEVFKRLHTRGNYPGTGIGLAICKKVVEHHGGRIWVESKPGVGATFRFTLQADVSDEGDP